VIYRVLVLQGLSGQQTFYESLFIERGITREVADLVLEEGAAIEDERSKFWIEKATRG